MVVGGRGCQSFGRVGSDMLFVLVVSLGEQEAEDVRYESSNILYLSTALCSYSGEVGSVTLVIETWTGCILKCMRSPLY